jgi:hypothetical protein
VLELLLCDFVQQVLIHCVLLFVHLPAQHVLPVKNPLDARVRLVHLFANELSVLLGVFFLLSGLFLFLLRKFLFFLLQKLNVRLL